MAGSGYQPAGTSVTSGQPATRQRRGSCNRAVRRALDDDLHGLATHKRVGHVLATRVVEHGVIAGAAADQVRLPVVLSADHVITRSGADLVAARSRHQPVRACVATQIVSGRATEQLVAVGTAEDGVAVRAATQDVTSRLAGQQVAAALAPHRVAPLFTEK